MNKKIYKKQLKLYLMLDLSTDNINNIFKICRNNLLKKNIKRIPHFTFMTIIFNKKYKNVIKFLKNKKHLNNIKKLVLLYFDKCILKPFKYSLLGLEEKKFYTKEYELSENCVENITLSRQIIYNYIALNIIYKKDTANKLFINYIKNNKNNEINLACKNFINKNNNNFIKFIYKNKLNNKIYDLFSVPEYSFKTNKHKFHISITDTEELKNYNLELYNKLNIINKEEIIDKLNNILYKKNIKWNNVYINKNSKFFISYNK